MPPSRPISAQFSLHDPALAHSRRTSEQFAYLALHAQQQQQSAPPVPPIPIQAPIPKREALNPLAKPFVFGSARGSSGSWSVGTFGPASASASASPAHQLSMSNGSTPGHERAPSLGKPLNATAAEFKPGQFTFRVPTNIPPILSQPALLQPSLSPALHTVPGSRPLPSPPVMATPVRATQGREKRQRRASDTSMERSDDEEEDEEENSRDIDNMTSFKFPADSPQSTRRSVPASPVQRHIAMDAFARPYGLPARATHETVPQNVHPPTGHSQSPDEFVESPEGDDDQNAIGDQDYANNGMVREKELPIPPSMKARRAPIPLDFKHPVSTNTVPAGLFKALANADDERTRRSVRSRLSSREVFEHVSRPSLDDLNMPAISRKVSGTRLVTDPGRWDTPHQRKDVFVPPLKLRRRSSLPQLRSSSSISGDSLPAVSISRRLEMQQFEDRLEALLDEKIESIRLEMQEQRLTSDGTLNPSTEAMINEVVSLFRAQLQESAARGLDDSQMDARGELDFQLVKDIVEQGHADARAMMHQDLSEIMRRFDSQTRESQASTSFNVQGAIEEFHNRTVKTVINSVSQLAARLESMERARTPHGVPAFDREGLVRELLSALLPHISVLRAEPIDYETLTNQLTQAVKPHISQLIDLASDKRETAGLIVDRLVPILPTIYPPTNIPDTNAIISQITNEVRKIVAPVDAHEIKEQVSDLVVERLDSRLAVRDRVLDSLPGKVADNVGQLLGPVRDVAAQMGALSQGLASQTRDLSSIHHDVLGLLSDLPARLSAATDALSVAQAEMRSSVPASVQNPAAYHNISQIESTVNILASSQQTLEDKNQELLALNKDMLAQLKALPETLAVTTKAVYDTRAELLTRVALKQDFEEVRRLMSSNSDSQVQLAKARAAHGSIRAEKDVLAERVVASEAERDRLRVQVDELQASVITRATEATAAEVKNAELEEALSQALGRLKTADVATQTQHERILELERANRDAAAEALGFRNQVRVCSICSSLSHSLMFPHSSKHWRCRQASLNMRRRLLCTLWSPFRESTTSCSRRKLTGTIFVVWLSKLRRFHISSARTTSPNSRTSGAFAIAAKYWRASTLRCRGVSRTRKIRPPAVTAPPPLRATASLRRSSARPSGRSAPRNMNLSWQRRALCSIKSRTSICSWMRNTLW